MKGWWYISFQTSKVFYWCWLVCKSNLKFLHKSHTIKVKQTNKKQPFYSILQYFIGLSFFLCDNVNIYLSPMLLIAMVVDKFPSLLPSKKGSPLKQLVLFDGRFFFLPWKSVIPLPFCEVVTSSWGSFSLAYVLAIALNSPIDYPKNSYMWLPDPRSCLLFPFLFFWLDADDNRQGQGQWEKRPWIWLLPGGPRATTKLTDLHPFGSLHKYKINLFCQSSKSCYILTETFPTYANEEVFILLSHESPFLSDTSLFLWTGRVYPTTSDIFFSLKLHPISADFFITHADRVISGLP